LAEEELRGGVYFIDKGNSAVNPSGITDAGLPTAVFKLYCGNFSGLNEAESYHWSPLP